MNTESASKFPGAGVRPAPAPPPGGLARLRSAVERGYWDSLEYLESAAHRKAVMLLMSGAEKHSGAPLRTLYFGSGNHLAYVQSLVYREHRVDAEHPGLRIWNVRRFVRQRGSDVDLVVADLPWPWHGLLRGRGYLEVPAWINQRMPLPERWQDVPSQWRRSARGEDLRSIRKQGLAYRLVRDEQTVRRFYEEMYVPHLTRRFGQAAYIEPEWKIRYCVENGSLMEILRDGRVAAAQVLWENRDMMHFLWAGTVDEEYGAQSRGLFPALYYFGILHAFESGCREADYCGTRAMLGDGIFQIKRRWGGRVYDGWSRDTLFLRPRNLDPANRAFLAHNPLIARTAGALVGKVFIGDEPAGPEHVTRADQVYASPGIGGIKLYSLQSPRPEALIAAREARGIEIVDLSGEPEPLSVYCR